jgi:mono/diheme cytochrome c family protein
MTRTVTTSLWLVTTILLAAIALVASQDDAPPKAEKILNTTCISCHDIRKIQTKALDADGWQKIVDSMIEKGAKVEKGDVPMLVSYLEDNFGPLPEGMGKEVVLEKCTVCHDLKRVRQHLASPEEWADTLGAMENEGLMISDEEFAIVLRYLARNFRQ